MKNTPKTNSLFCPECGSPVVVNIASNLADSESVPFELYCDRSQDPTCNWNPIHHREWRELFPEYAQKPILSPGKQLRNVARIVLGHTQVTRPWNGRGRSATYTGRIGEIAPAARQLAEMVLKYLDGKLVAIEDDGSPF